MDVRYLSLSHTLVDAMPCYPGSKPPDLNQVAKVESDGYTMTVATLNFHTGTHVDAPVHMIEGGQYIDEIAIEHFVGNGVMFDVRGKDIVDVGDIITHRLVDADIVLFYTGFSSCFGQPEYFDSHPVITPLLAQLLVEQQIKMAGFDTPSPDKAPFNIHQILLANTVLIIENMTNLAQLLDVNTFEVISIPPKTHTEAAFVNVVAKINQESHHDR